MVKSGYSKLTSYFKVLFLGVFLTQNALNISGTLISLLYSSEECSYNLRTWLIIHSSVTFFTFLLYLFYKYFGFSLWCLWNLAWSIFGTIQTLGDNDCISDFPIGFASALIMVLISYFILSLVFSICCLFGISTCVGHGLTSMYREIDP